MFCAAEEVAAEEVEAEGATEIGAAEDGALDGTPAEVPAAAMLSALTTATAAMFKLPVLWMPASPASTEPAGARR
jgi:hypothetical protein